MRRFKPQLQFLAEQNPRRRGPKFSYQFTFFEGGFPGVLPKMDGVNQWPSLTLNRPSPRTEILLNINEVLQVAALRIDRDNFHWKLVVGKFFVMVYLTD